MKRCVIVGGADINDPVRIRSYMNEDDFVIYCDCGLRHMEMLNVSPDLIVGDFDSHKNPKLNVETIVLPVEKDDTDTIYAVKYALNKGFKEFLLIGVVGQRFDHTMANISILPMLYKHNAHGQIADDYSLMELVTDRAAVENGYSFFSLVALGGDAKGVTIKDAKYCIEDAVITCDYQYGVSNETLPGKTAYITVKEGMLLLIKDF